jgi:hydrogenase expression/formation protein HypD
METNKDLQEKIEYLKNYDGRPLKLMEVCGTHTAGIFRSGLRTFLSPKIRLISGPGCPVCVTPTAYIDRCNELACTEAHALISFGDMLKVPGSHKSLSEVKGQGGRVEMVYSPFDVIAKAEREPAVTFVMAAVGFETTAPAYALLLEEVAARGLRNVKLLTALKSAIPAIAWICENETSVDGFLCPGHVSVVTGGKIYASLAKRYRKPFVIAGFEGRHLVNAVCRLVEMATETGGEPQKGAVHNLYAETVTDEGNRKAQEMTDKYFMRSDAVWRGLGTVPASGFWLREQYAAYDIGSRALTADCALPAGCRCADVITGRIDPDACPMFGHSCKPGHAEGPCMVSAEGACGIWYANRAITAQRL